MYLDLLVAQFELDNMNVGEVLPRMYKHCVAILGDGTYRLVSFSFGHDT
jgi:hypothetical protein